MGISLDTGAIRLPRWAVSIFVVLAFTAFSGVFSSKPGGGGGAWWILDLAAGAGCAYLVRRGFRQLREKNMIENVPSSPIRSVAMGLAEIKGKACGEATLSAPFSQARCHYFRYLVEEERQRGKGGKEWVTVDQGKSNVPFSVEDPTGKILVNPEGADITLKRDYQTIENGEGWFGRRKRYSEWRIDPGDALYLLGTVSKQQELMEERRAALGEKLRQVKHDPATLKRFDLDDNGTLDEQEWAGAVAVVRRELLDAEAARKAAQPQSDLVVGAGDTESMFVISDRDERSIARLLGWKALGFVGLGGAGLLAMAASILGRFGIIQWSFPWAALFS